MVTHGSLRIGFTHGHTIIPPGDADSLLIAARHMDVDVLLWGGTHKFEAYELEGKFFVNPGSATGALGTGWWSEGEEPVPSFCLMDVSLIRPHPRWAKALIITTVGSRRRACALCISAKDRPQWCGDRRG